jgi:hypothetical protein
VESSGGISVVAEEDVEDDSPSSDVHSEASIAHECVVPMDEKEGRHDHHEAVEKGSLHLQK